jgi:ribosomal protein L40E
MRCSKCGTNNPSTNNFCAKCGSALARHCAKCKAENPPTSDFCGKCGAPLTNAAGTAGAISSPQALASDVRVTPEQPDASTPIEGERKTVTALFADIKGSMELMEDLDPEEARAIIDPALRLMIDAADGARCVADRIWTISELVAAALEPSDVAPPLPCPTPDTALRTGTRRFRLIVGRGGKGTNMPQNSGLPRLLK